MPFSKGLPLVSQIIHGAMARLVFIQAFGSAFKGLSR
jgi:hypothetical protein